MTENYNRFIELAQYYMAGNVDAPTLISKFMSRLWPPIVDKIVEHWFNTLIDCYASAQLANANIESRNVERAQQATLGIARIWPSRGWVAGRHRANKVAVVIPVMDSSDEDD